MIFAELVPGASGLTGTSRRRYRRYGTALPGCVGASKVPAKVPRTITTDSAGHQLAISGLQAAHPTDGQPKGMLITQSDGCNLSNNHRNRAYRLFSSEIGFGDPDRQVQIVLL